MHDLLIRCECKSDYSYVLYADLSLEQGYQQPLQINSTTHMAVPLKAIYRSC